MSNSINVIVNGQSVSKLIINRPKYDDIEIPYKIIDDRPNNITAEEIKKYPRLREISPHTGRNRVHCIRFKEIHPDLFDWCLSDNPSYQNTCATRMSYASVQGMIKFLKIQFKGRDVNPLDEKKIIQIKEINKIKEVEVLTDNAINKFINDITNKKGIIIYEIPIWPDATGHVTLWDGKECVDGTNHFVDSPTNLLFWELR